MSAHVLQIASDLIARQAKLQPSTRLLREKFLDRIRNKGELPTIKSIGYWRNYVAALQMQTAHLCVPLLDAAKHGDQVAFTRINRIINALRAAASDRPPEEERKRREGRVRNLSKVGEGWQELVYSKLSGKWKPAFSVMALTGCRPGELNGLEIRPTDQEGVLVFRIKGKKVTEKAGQAWRELTIDVRGAAGGEALIEAIGAEGGALEIKDSPQAITKALTRAAQRAKLIRMDQTLPAYVCRNAVASGMKADGHGIEKVAAALGHSTDECQKYYGRASAGHKSGGGKVLEVLTARPVRETAHTLGYQFRRGPEVSR